MHGQTHAAHTYVMVIFMRVQPRRHAVDEGWDGEGTNGHAEDGAADGWDCQNGRPDPYARADRALQRAQADVAEQRDRLEKVRLRV
jgi:hypothetical protein